MPRGRSIPFEASARTRETASGHRRSTGSTCRDGPTSQLPGQIAITGATTMDSIALAIFALALVVNAGTPGPSVPALVSRVISNGWRDVAPFGAAMRIGEVV